MIKKHLIFALIILIFIPSYARSIPKWERIKVGTAYLLRIKAPKGWLVSLSGTGIRDYSTVTYVPDPNHEWKIK